MEVDGVGCAVLPGCLSSWRVRKAKHRSKSARNGTPIRCQFPTNPDMSPRSRPFAARMPTVKQTSDVLVMTKEQTPPALWSRFPMNVLVVIVIVRSLVSPGAAGVGGDRYSKFRASQGLLAQTPASHRAMRRHANFHPLALATTSRARTAF